MERRITKHSTRLSVAHEGALDQGFHVGQRVRTLDGLIGRILLITESFSPGNTEYQVVLDSGMGGGTYLGSQLRPLPEAFGGGHQAPAHLPAGVTARYITEDEAREAYLETLASTSYPEMGSVLFDRPDPGRQLTVIGAKTAVGPYQQKLFHMQHEPRAECPECGYQEWERDPEIIFHHVRHQQQARDEYEPEECPHCGSDLKDRWQHEEDHQDWLHEQDWHTDWNEEQPGDTLHRGISMALPQSLHDYVHNEDHPVHERAHALLSHITRHIAKGSYHGGLGNFWSDEPDVSKSYAETSTAHSKGREGNSWDQTPVMLHVKFPGMEHVETDPDTLSYWGVHSYHKAGNREVPIQNQAPLTIKGVSWGPPDHGLGAGTYSYKATPDSFHDDEAYTHHYCAPGTCGQKRIRAHAAQYADGYDPREEDYNGEPDLGIYWAAPAQQAFVHDELGEPEEVAMETPEGLEEELTGAEPGMNPPPPEEGEEPGPGPVQAMSMRQLVESARQLQVQRRPHREREEGPGPWRGLPQRDGGDEEDEDEEDILSKIDEALGEKENGQHTATTINGQPVDGHGDAPGHGTEDRAADPNAYDDRSTEDQGDDRWSHPVSGPLAHEYNGAAIGMFPEGISAGGGPGISIGASYRDDVSDRWHEYNQQWRPDTLHRGVHAELPPHLHAYVHDEGEPREERARALAAHFEGTGLGRHWTPHTNIAQRAIWNAADATEPDESGHGYDYDEDDWGEGDDGYDGYDERTGEPKPTHTDVMFHVRRPGRRNEVRDPRQLEQHEVGWQFSRGEDETFLRHDAPLKLEGISWKLHEPEYPNEPFEHVDFAKPMRHTARVPWTPEQRTQLHSWQAGGPTASEGDFVPSSRFTNDYPTYDPEADLEMTAPPEVIGPEAFEEELHRRQAARPNRAHEVATQLAKNFPPQATSWVHDAQWEGPHRVPLKDIDFSGRDSWQASHDPGAVKKMRKKMQRRDEKGEDQKPAILVSRPGMPKQMIADGHHRALAEEELAARGEDRGGLYAWTGKVPGDKGPWDTMHDHQGEPPEEFTGPQDDGDDLDYEEMTEGIPPPGQEDDALFEPGAEPGMNPPAAGPGDDSLETGWPPQVTTGLPPLSQGGTPGPRTKNYAPVVPPPWMQSGTGHELEQAQPPGQEGPPGEEDDDSGEEEEGSGKDQSLDSFEKAASSAAFRFEFCASWADVQAKARRIHRDGGVRITAMSRSLVIGEVKGDHATYEVGNQYYPGRGFSVMAYSCGCPWASFHQDPDYPGRFAGRMCSHALALGIEARSRGVVQRAMFPDLEGWPAEVTVKSWPPFDDDTKRWRVDVRAPMTRRPVMSSLGAAGEPPALAAARVLLGAGEGRAAVTALLATAGLIVLSDQANAPWGAQNVSEVPPQKPYGATSPPQKDQDPGSYGLLSAPDPDNWGEIQDNSAVQMPLTNEAARVSEDENVLDTPATNDWADEGQSLSYQDPGSRIIDSQGSLGASRRSWARQGSGSARPGSSGLGRFGTARQETGPGEDTKPPGAMDTQAAPVTTEPAGIREYQESFPYVSQAPAAGPSTSITPRDPQGIRFEEALLAARRSFTAAMARTAQGADPDDPSNEEHPAQLLDIATNETGDAQDVPHEFSDKGDSTCTTCGLTPAAVVHSRAQGQHDLARHVTASAGDLRHHLINVHAWDPDLTRASERDLDQAHQDVHDRWPESQVHRGRFRGAEEDIEPPRSREEELREHVIVEHPQLWREVDPGVRDHVNWGFLHGAEHEFGRLRNPDRPRGRRDWPDHDHAAPATLLPERGEDPVPFGEDAAHYHAHEGPIDPVFGAKAPPLPGEGALAELKDEPEGALDPEGLTAFDPSGQHAVQVGQGISGRAQYPDQFTTQNPGMGSLDEPSVPDDSSIQTIGQQQWSGVDYNSGDLTAPGEQAEHPAEGEDADIVRQFQASRAGAQYSGDGAVQTDGDIAAAARAFLVKQADCLPPDEADELIREGRGTRARNLDMLDLEGTHYIEDPRLDDADDDVIYA